VTPPRGLAASIQRPTRPARTGASYSQRAFFTDALADAGKSTDHVTPAGRRVAPPVIEHDVWIGSRVTLARGIAIGTSAIVAAGAVVTRDVPSYAMVAGNPARAKKFRFNEPLIARLLASRWWTHSFVEFGGMPTTEPERFLDQLEERREQGRIAAYEPHLTALHAEPSESHIPDGPAS
jgi:hypothetical protein